MEFKNSTPENKTAVTENGLTKPTNKLKQRK